MEARSEHREEMRKQIEGKVAAILNARELAMNVGAEAGVKDGMRFEVLDSKPVEIKDPDTSEVIGTADIAKIKVKVTEVQDRMSIARTYETYNVNVGGTGFPLGALIGMPPKWETRVRTLKAEEWAVEPLEEESSFVKVGDKVREIVGAGEET